jgi:hypothetical protein
MGHAAIEIHLPKPILGNGIAKPEKEIVGHVVLDEGDPSTIPGNRHRPGDSYNLLPPSPLRTDADWKGGNCR